MPRFHHKRRHSWPYCGSSTQLKERNLPAITVTGPDDEFEGQFLTPIESDELFEDDAAYAGIVRSQSSRSHRLWHHSKDKKEAYQANAGTVSLRKMMQPPLDRARSFFVLPSTVSTKEMALLPYWVHRLSAHPIAAKERKAPQTETRGRLMVEKNHRRCHSERPRSWKQPSEDLWTLLEE
ncbi:hypothetical protein BDW74DRAFT_83404 [Aspergillus multicolor]|uniref:uncharacterized protein n=1 Tax=Aspergillus multicolor TaxID=41759 RepID=UPI003CCE4123